MGYYTSYSLSWDCSKSKTVWGDISNKIKSLQNDGKNFFRGVNDFGESVDSCKWYSHEKDVAEFSKLFPDVLFELEGEGEDSGDIWKKYFLNGKVQVCNAKVTFAAFNKSKLEIVK